MFDEVMAAAPVIGGHRGTLDEGLAANALAEVFAHVAEHAHLYRALVGDGGSARVINHMHDRLAISIHVNLSGAGDGRGTHADDPSEIPHDPVAAFLAGALLGNILDWLRRGCPGTAGQMSAAIWPLLHGAATAAGAVPAAL
ncbi:TetR-like C-terminal domain-containing protein [Nonomuraea sp. NPDC049709]|uniref:TetR-like C-terminal domain-containing protein n=1 Tax=Nonomuraea sp. NPDC049709 TaxID=3154736 RepID=UPI003430ED67